MVALPGGVFVMGAETHYREEGPVHERTVAPFALDVHPVTNAEFGAFVDATGYLTVAERPLEAHFGADNRAPGSLVFTPTTGPVDLRDWRRWWRWRPGADWRHPTGPGSSLDGKDEHPVVQVCYVDASAYAQWVGKRLPSEAEWEYAARVGSDPAWPYAWGVEAQPGGRLMANTWQGRFPFANTGADGWVGTSPVGAFPANPAGFVDLIGNVWELTSTPYLPRHRPPDPGPGCCGPQRGDMTARKRVLKGGSHLCAPEYCLRYRPAARSPTTDDSATTHIGFRCARTPGPAPS